MNSKVSIEYALNEWMTEYPNSKSHIDNITWPLNSRCATNEVDFELQFQGWWKYINVDIYMVYVKIINSDIKFLNYLLSYNYQNFKYSLYIFFNYFYNFIKTYFIYYYIFSSLRIYSWIHIILNQKSSNSLIEKFNMVISIIKPSIKKLNFLTPYPVKLSINPLLPNGSHSSNLFHKYNYLNNFNNNEI